MGYKLNFANVIEKKYIKSRYIFGLVVQLDL